MAALIPEDAPGWAIRLEAKLDIAIAQHGQAIESLSREVSGLRRDAERKGEKLEATDVDLDKRVDALERSNFVTPKGLWAALGGTVGLLVGVATLINAVSNLI